jgi:hypothetical protein
MMGLWYLVFGYFIISLFHYFGLLRERNMADRKLQECAKYVVNVQNVPRALQQPNCTGSVKRYMLVSVLKKVKE